MRHAASTAKTRRRLQGMTAASPRTANLRQRNWCNDNSRCLTGTFLSNTASRSDFAKPEESPFFLAVGSRLTPSHGRRQPLHLPPASSKTHAGAMLGAVPRKLPAKRLVLRGVAPNYEYGPSALRCSTLMLKAAIYPVVHEQWPPRARSRLPVVHALVPNLNPEAILTFTFAPIWSNIRALSPYSRPSQYLAWLSFSTGERNISIRLRTIRRRADRTASLVSIKTPSRCFLKSYQAKYTRISSARLDRRLSDYQVAAGSAKANFTIEKLSGDRRIVAAGAVRLDHDFGKIDHPIDARAFVQDRAEGRQGLDGRFGLPRAPTIASDA